MVEVASNKGGWLYPTRCMDLFRLLEPVAREKKLVGSFSLIVATSVFLIPYERMKARHPLRNSSADEKEIDSRLRRVERQRFGRAEFWASAPDAPWRFSRIINDVNRSFDWCDETGQHPLRTSAINTIKSRSVNDVLRVVRNALAHGNVVYLDEYGHETPGAKVKYLGFLSRYEETEEARAKATTYRLVATTEDGFLQFVKCWANWLAKFPVESRFLEAAE